MTTLEHELSQDSAAASPLTRVAPALFGATLCVSAFLLFAIQPMFAKMVLPKLGGAPAVWSVAMVFFQSALLAGYAYAHALARVCGAGRGALVHLGLLIIAAAMLPIGVAMGFGAPPEHGVHLWVLALFAASVGLPFAALAASAPLLQSWFVASGHVQARNPYVLYAASNLGSFAALIAYPLLLEPFLSLRGQAQLWTFGYAGLAVMIAAAALLVARTGSAEAGHAAVAAPATTWPQRLYWMVLAAIPSGLVIGVTAFISTDVAAAPFLWIVPLALYLLTFVAVFRERPWLRHATAVWLVPFVAGPMAISILGGDKVFWLAVIAINLVGFFLLSLVCHGTLYRQRPTPARLTEYYLWISLGGAVGGVLAGLVAPNVFSNIYEYPILIVAALMALPGVFAGGARGFLRAAGPWLLIAAAATLLGLAMNVQLPAAAELPFQIVLVVLVVLIMLQRHSPARVIGLVTLTFVVAEMWRPGLARIEVARSFFGVHKILESTDGRYRMLMHGTTMHGAEQVRHADGTPVDGRPTPLTYYYFGGPISEAIAAVRGAQKRLDRVALVGLGAGSLACHKQAGETWTFFEIDSQVVRLARDRFRFLSACGGDVGVVVGDARLTLAVAPRRFDLIVLDAFSSDAIPVHLLTREAFAGYLSRLTDSGVIVVHISNRHMELARVVATVGASERLITAVKQDTRAQDSGLRLATNSLVAALARREADFGDLLGREGWRRIDSDPSVAAWTDDYSNLLAAIRRKKFGW